LKRRWSLSANAVSGRNRPVRSRAGQRDAREHADATRGRLAEEAVGRLRRNMLKMICTDCTPGCSIARSASSTRSTLTP
jgi:hypothetical protein